MSQNHYTTKTKRRPRNSRRKDYTQETMLSLRSPQQQQQATIRTLQNENAVTVEKQRIAQKKAARAMRWV